MKAFTRVFVKTVLILALLSITAGALTEQSANPPGATVNSYTGSVQPFNITVDQRSNFTWKVDNVTVSSSDINMTTSSISPPGTTAGVKNVNVIAILYNGTANVSHSWSWNVTVPPITAPAFTTAPNATNKTETSADISFVINQNDAKTSVRYGINASLGSGPLWNNNSGTSRTIQITGLSKGTTYNYIVYLYNGSDLSVSTNSSLLSFSLPNPANPIISSISAGQITDTGASINFTVDQNDANTGVNYGADNASLIFWNWRNGTSYGTLRTIPLTGLNHGTTYYYKVYAYNAMNNTYVNNTSVYNFVTYNPTAPNISNVTQGTPNENSINISFNLDQANARARIDYGLTDSLGSSTLWNNQSGTLRTIAITGLTQATKYFYRVYAQNITNESFSNTSIISNFTTRYPGPTLTNASPSSTNDITAGGTQSFSITVGAQNGTLTWYRNDTQLQSQAVNSGETITYIYNRTDIGTYKIIATISNENGNGTRDWILNVRPTTYFTGNRIWDGGRPDLFALKYSWTPQSFSGFYYNAKDDVGTENITITMDGYSSGTIKKGNLIYKTSPQEVTFAFSNFGKYQVIGFMADKYFAGYTKNTSISSTGKQLITRPTTDFEGKSALSQGELHKVLIDEDVKRTISVGGTLALQDGYVLKAKDIDLKARTMLLSLLKDGNEVDISPLSADETYVYAKTVGGVESLPLIMVRFDNVFSGQELQVAFMKGIFQISEYATIVKSGNQFRNMKVDTVGKDLIQMSNDGDISLGKGSTADVMGDVKIKVADNDSVLRFALSVEKTGAMEVRSTVYRYEDTNPVLLWTPYNFGMNIGSSSIGFYYDLDDGLGNESLKLVDKVSGRSIPEKGLEYSTTPSEVKFTYTGFGKYQVIGFMADKYFAGYTINTGKSSSGTRITTRPTTDFEGKSTLANGALHKVLVDDDTKRTISVGGTIALKEGYVLKATDIDLNARAMLLTLLKDGNEVDVSPLSKDETYVYTKTVGGTENLPLIMVRFDNVFSGGEIQAAFMKGLFQISENPTTVKAADQFGSMEVRSVSRDKIMMSNDGTIGLDKNKNEALMGNLRLKVADNDNLRFYFAVDVTPQMIANQLVIDAPSKSMAGDTIRIKVTAGGNVMDNASLALDTDIGITDKDGILNYTLPKNLKGTYNFTATKTGYEKATKNIEIEKYVDYTLSLDAPSNANQYETITIKVLYNGTGMGEASVLFDNNTIGTTDSNGELTYKLESSGTHSITASKKSYITVSRDIEIRAPYSEYRALDINITPNPGFANENFRVISNITNVGTKGDTLPVELIINGTIVDNRSVTLGAGEKTEINFTTKETKVANITIEILEQSMLYEVKEKPTNYLLIGAIVTGIGVIIIYILTSKGMLSLELLKQKFNQIFGK